MRISNIQNTALNVMNALSGNHSSVKSIGNNFGQNNLERNPAMDTVSFGQYDKRHHSTIDTCVTNKLAAQYEGWCDLIMALQKSKFLKVFLTRNSSINPKEAICEVVPITAHNNELIQEFNKEECIKFNDTMSNYIKRFNEVYSYHDELDEDGNLVPWDSDWMEHLETPEEYKRAGELAMYLDSNMPYGSSGSRDGFESRNINNKSRL